MKWNIIIPLGSHSKHGDFELRHSLRSIKKHMIDVGQDVKIMIVGHKPDWLSPTIGDGYLLGHMPFDQPYLASQNKDGTMIAKHIAAMVSMQITTTREACVISSDDIYLMADVIDRDHFKPWLETPSQYTEDKRKFHHSKWLHRLYKTVKLQEKLGLPNWVIESHTPYEVDAYRYVKLMLQQPFGEGVGLVTHMYYALDHANWEIPPSPDWLTCRFKEGLNRQEIEAKASGKRFLNHDDRGLSAGMKEFLEDRFSEAAPWESKELVP